MLKVYIGVQFLMILMSLGLGMARNSDGQIYRYSSSNGGTARFGGNHVGNKHSFAVELEILDGMDGWVFGTFLFWIKGIAAGDPGDNSVDLKGCIDWLRGYLEDPPNRVDPELSALDKDAAYSRLYDSVLAGGGDQVQKEELSRFYSRFHVSHIGMSSFDKVTIVLLEDGRGMARCIWQQGNQEVQDAYLEMGCISQVFMRVVECWESYRSHSLQ